MKRPNFGRRGFTLVELVFVIAIIVILASIFLPLAISKLRKADDAVADASIQEIAAALASFYDDLRDFPTCGGGPAPASAATDCSTLETGTDNQLVFLAFGSGFGTPAGDYPDALTGAGNWDFAVNDEINPVRNNAANHLVVNDPVTTSGGGAPDASDYKSSGSKKWRGPYLSRVKLDPWARTYIAYVGAMEKGGKTISGASGTQKGWILSAGSDNSLDTAPTGLTLSGDDRGFIFHTE